MNTLWIATAIVILLWIIIFGVYLVTVRRQPDLKEQMRALDKQLDKLDSESVKR